MKDKYKLISGFDSIYLFNEDEDSMTGTFKHDYVINNNYSRFYLIMEKCYHVM